MKSEQVSFHIENSAALRLLRSKQATLALSFFHHAFKASNRLQVPHIQLQELLEKFLEDEFEQTEESQTSFASQAQYYLDLWCNDSHRFLRKYYELNQDEPVMELTADAERALEWLYSLEKKEFVGTQSRFLNIFDGMKGIVDQTHEDPTARLAFLKEQRKSIDVEIKQIQTTGTVNRMDGTLIRERFLNIIDDSRRLVSEFRLVEDIFKELTRKIKEQKLKESVTKGDILRQVLDAHDFLEESDQGKSFSAFWNFLISDESQNLLREYSEKILQTPEIDAFIRQNPERQMDTALRKLKGQLLQAGQKVLRSKFRLSEELRKLLHQRTLAENKRVLELTAQIKKLLVENLDVFLARSQRDFTYVEDCGTVQMPLSRPLWQLNVDAKFASKNLETPNGADDLSELSDLIHPQPFTEFELEGRIESLLAHSPQISLLEVVNRYPIQYGTPEVVAYLTLAAKSTRHFIDGEHSDLIPCPLQKIILTAPRVIFTRSEGLTTH